MAERSRANLRSPPAGRKSGRAARPQRGRSSASSTGAEMKSRSNRAASSSTGSSIREARSSWSAARPIDGRPVWKLEGVVGFTQRGRGARLQPILGEVILVDPTTYLPVIEREVDLTRTGHPTMLETRLIHYRRIPQGPRSEALVLLSAVHRGAPTISRRVPVPLHVARAQVERRLRRNPTKAGDADATGSIALRRPDLGVRCGSRRRPSLGDAHAEDDHRAHLHPDRPDVSRAARRRWTGRSLRKRRTLSPTGAAGHRESCRLRPAARTGRVAARRKHFGWRDPERQLAGRPRERLSPRLLAPGRPRNPPEPARVPRRRRARHLHRDARTIRTGASPTPRPTAECTRSNSATTAPTSSSRARMQGSTRAARTSPARCPRRATASRSDASPTTTAANANSKGRRRPTTRADRAKPPSHPG